MSSTVTAAEASTMNTSFGYTDSVSTSKAVSVPDLSYAADFAVRSEVARETILTNITSPVDQPETIRYAIEPVSNIYTGTGIDPAFFATSKKGFSLVVGVDDILRITDSTKPEFCMDLPIHTHLVVRIPSSTYVSADRVMAVIGRNIAALFDTGSTGTNRLQALMRQSMTPSGL